MGKFKINPITGKLDLAYENSIDFGEVISGGDYNQFVSAINAIIEQIETLTYAEGDLITVEMIANYQSIFDNLQNLFNEISNIPGVDQSVVSNLQTLLSNFDTFITGLVEGQNLSAEQFLSVSTTLSSILTILSQLASSTSSDSELRATIESILNEYGISSVGDSQTVRLSGVISYVAGLTFHATDLKYKILGKAYESFAKDLTCEAADVTNPRIDVIAGDTFGNVFIIKGTPAANPVKPQVAYNQIEFTHVDIAAGATEPGNFAVEVVFDELVAGEWVPTSEADANITVNTADESAPATGTKHISVELDIPAATGNSPTHYIGERYQGGVIFWLDPTSGGQKGLICALEDAAQGVFWSNLSGSDVYTTGATDTAIGTGQSNTDKLLASEAAFDDAAKYADEFISGGFADWFIGSEDEMIELYNRRYSVGGLAGKTLWTSTESNWKRARRIEFNGGTVATRDKNNRYDVRPIRKFDDTLQDFSEPVTEYSPVSVKITLTAPTTKSLANGILTADVNTSLSWLSDSAILIESWNGGIKTGAVALTPINPFGFNANKTGEYQPIGIPMSVFGANSSNIDALTISLINTWRNKTVLKLDNIRIQYDANVVDPLKLGTMAYKDYWGGTQAEYDALVTKDGNTIYFIEEE